MMPSHRSILLALTLLVVVACDGGTTETVEPSGVPVAQGDLLVRQGKIAEGLEVYRNAILDGRELDRALPGLWRLYGNLGETHAGIEMLGTLAARRPENPEIAFFLGYAWEQLRNLDRALDAYGQALAATPTHRNSLLSLGTACLSKGRYQRGVDAFETPEVRGMRPDADLDNMRGVLYLRVGRPAAALDAFRKGLRAAPEDRLIRANLGMALALAGEDEAADTVLSGVLAEDPEYAQALHSLADLRYRQGRSAEADALMERFRLRQIEIDAAAGQRNFIDQQ